MTRAWSQLDDDDDYENEGHAYGQEDRGGMFVSNTETTYELEGLTLSLSLALALTLTNLKACPRKQGAMTQVPLPTIPYNKCICHPRLERILPESSGSSRRKKRSRSGTGPAHGVYFYILSVIT